jgi:hypothetical protein
VKRGFVLLIVIAMLFFIGTILFVFTGVSNKIVFQTNRIYLEAVEQNLISSGLIWAKHNIAKEGESIKLDTAGISGWDAQLNITMGKHRQAEISTYCRRGSQELKTNEKYDISARGNK